MTPPGRQIPSLPYQPALLGGLQRRLVQLPDYDEPYELIEMDPRSTLARLLRAAGAVRVPVPADLREQHPLMGAVSTRVTRTLHSQTPHIDFPHPPGDPRRYNLFWAEQPRQGARTFFIPRRCTDSLVRLMTAFLAGSAAVWADAEPVIVRWADDPRSLSRYPLPDHMVHAFTRLVYDSDTSGWERLSAFGKTTVCARVLGNTVAATQCVDAILSGLGDAVLVEEWKEPVILIADDTQFFHGRRGVGETGGDFFRIWLTGPPVSGFSYVQSAAVASAS